MPFVEYSETNSAEWDSFVLEQSINGNFLQTRRFLSYHPEGKFVDTSLMYYDNKGNLHAVIPAAVGHSDDGGKRFFSHPGSTYGGIVIDKKMSRAKKLQGLLEELDEYFANRHFGLVELKFPPAIMWTHDGAALMEYMLTLNGYSELCELTTYIDYSHYPEPLISNLSQGKRTNVHNCEKRGLELRLIEPESPLVNDFYELLCANLSKYDTKPVHSLEELKLLSKQVLAGETEIVGIFDADQMIAGGWIFIFENQQIAHTQYLCADSTYSKLSPMSYLYFRLVERYKNRGFKALTWGISTEDAGRILNMGLTESKESFGSSHGVHRRFIKRFSEQNRTA